MFEQVHGGSLIPRSVCVGTYRWVYWQRKADFADAAEDYLDSYKIADHIFASQTGYRRVLLGNSSLNSPNVY